MRGSPEVSPHVGFLSWRPVYGTGSLAPPAPKPQTYGVTLEPLPPLTSAVNPGPVASCSPVQVRVSEPDGINVSHGRRRDSVEPVPESMCGASRGHSRFAVLYLSYPGRILDRSDYDMSAACCQPRSGREFYWGIPALGQGRIQGCDVGPGCAVDAPQGLALLPPCRDARCGRVVSAPGSLGAVCSGGRSRSVVLPGGSSRGVALEFPGMSPRSGVVVSGIVPA